ncbi:hypothetical protein PPERSA_00741 [Pseudocohnilembus persalinus]|uniref:Uncharacterized protein n=1 Tax=Pseudocohnilembus persalinus TaxID=266149 RepID=A0A0V0R4Q0_PSEPJ|nr:hypothetical protein PPERSA_00741 [Pseudocohnilembus persalinus]|eukprot:KRX09462.1 hypothetical protein PPERSA_00741 [Pseudocohnilembus persalinus]
MDNEQYIQQQNQDKINEQNYKQNIVIEEKSYQQIYSELTYDQIEEILINMKNQIQNCQDYKENYFQIKEKFEDLKQKYDDLDIDYQRNQIDLKELQNTLKNLNEKLNNQNSIKQNFHLASINNTFNNISQENSNQKFFTNESNIKQNKQLENQKEIQKIDPNCYEQKQQYIEQQIQLDVTKEELQKEKEKVQDLMKQIKVIIEQKTELQESNKKKGQQILNIQEDLKEYNIKIQGLEDMRLQDLNYVLKLEKQVEELEDLQSKQEKNYQLQYKQNSFCTNNMSKDYII